MAQGMRERLQERLSAPQGGMRERLRERLESNAAEPQAVAASKPTHEGLPHISIEGPMRNFRAPTPDVLPRAYTPTGRYEPVDWGQEAEAAVRTVARTGLEAAASLPQAASILLRALDLAGEETGFPVFSPLPPGAGQTQLEGAAQAILDKRPDMGKTEFPFLTQSLASGATQMGLFALGGAAAGVAGAAARMAAIATQGAMLEMSSGWWESMAAKPGDEETALKVALARAPGGASEAALDVFFRVNKLSGGAMSRAVRGAIVGEATEVPQEVGQTVWANAVTRHFLDPSQGYFENVGEAAAVAAILGGAVGGVVGSIGGFENAEPTPENVEALLKAIRAAETPQEPAQATQPAPESLAPEAAMEPVEDLTGGLVPEAPQDPGVEADVTSAPLQRHIDVTSAPLQRHIDATSAPLQRHIDATSAPLESEAAPDPESDTYRGRKGWALLRSRAAEAGLPDVGRLTRAQIVEGLRAQEAVQEAPVAPVEPETAPVEPEVPEAPEAVEPAPEPAPEPSDETVSVKNRKIDAERAAMGLPPATHGEKRTWERLNEEAAAQEEADPFAGQSLLRDIAGRESERPLRDDEVILATRELNRLKNERNQVETDLIAAQEAGDMESVKALDERARLLQNEVFEAGEILTRAGTVSGQALAARRAEMREDYSLAALERTMRAARGGEPLTDTQRTEIRELSQKLDEAQRKFDEHVANAELERATLEAENALLRVKKATGRARTKRSEPGKVLEFISKRADEARARIKARGPTASAGFNPAAWVDHTIVGAEYIAKDIASLGAWSKAMIEEFGETIRPYLKEIFAQSKEVYDSYGRQVSTEETKEKLTAAAAKEDGIAGSPHLVRQLAEGFVAEGIDTVGDLADAVHGVLQEIDPNITRREVFTLISGYGDLKRLSKNATKVRLRELKGEMRELSKLADMIQERTAPKRSGVERQEPTDRERRLTQQVEELKKKFNLQAVDPETQLKSALDALKTRLRNQIADLQKQIDDRVMTVKRPTKLARDEEATALEKERDALKETYDEVFSEEKETQRTDKAIAAIEKSIAEYERRIAEKDLSPRAAKNPVRANEELEAARNYRDLLREELALLRNAQKPKKSPEEIALQSAKTRLLSERARLQDALARGNFERKARTPVVLDDAGATLKAEVEMLRKEFRRGVLLEQRKNRTRAQKVGAALLEPSAFVRAIRSAWDASAPFRQAAYVWVPDLLVFNPPRAIRQFRDMLKAGRSDKEMERQDALIRSRPMAKFSDQAKLDLTSLDDDLSPREEAIQSNLSDHVPGVRMSNRMFITFLNRVRAEAFDRIANGIPEATPEELRHIAFIVNMLTGRGEVHGRFAGAMPGLAHLLWAPKLMFSRFQILLGSGFYSFKGGPGWRGTKRTRRLMAKEYGRILAGMAALYGLFALAGGEFEWDPRSSDFGKVRFGGKTRADPMAGLSQVTVFMSRIFTGKTKRLSGEIVPIYGPDAPYGQSDATAIAGRFARSKLAPGIAVPWNIVSREDFLGRPITPLDVAKDSLLPLAMGDVYESVKEHGAAEGAALGMLALLGIGIQVYEDNASASRPTRPTRPTRPQRP